MKKAFLLCAAATAAMTLLASCNKEEQKNDNKKDDGVEVTANFAIDGNFADWDALTAETANEYDVIVPINDDYKSLKAVKISSTDSEILVYAEIAVDKIQLSETAHEGGNSNDGHGDGTPGPFILYLDLDGNPETGFTTHSDADGNPLISGIGCEVGVEDYWFISAGDGKCYLGWSQIISEPTDAADGDEYQQDSWWQNGGTGGWDPANDNLAPRLDSYKTKIEGSTMKVEFAMERSVLASMCTRHEMGSTIIVGARYYNNDMTASWGLSGLTKAATVKLR